MKISIFDVLGPVMIGPSSSHTAGAAKLSRIATKIAPKGFCGIEFSLAGSFEKTGKGHGTDKALLAGAMGLCEDDENIQNAFTLADATGLKYEFTTIEMPESHENSVRIIYFYDNSSFFVEGSSLGGGRILITNINGTEVSLSAEAPTILITQLDRAGVVSEVSHILAENSINIGVMRVERLSRGDMASCVIETDAEVPEFIAEKLRKVENVLTVSVLN